MFYYLVRFYVRVALLFFCRSIRVNDKNELNQKGPLLLACTHPNSFFDAVLLGSKFNAPVHFLARGDAFNKPFVKKLLVALKCIPIYRLKEGREYLSLNDATFEHCKGILQQGGIILIFSEGLCIHQWKLRPLKKGTARIAISTWNDSQETPLRVLPVSINYNSFNNFGKRIIVEFGTSIKKQDIKPGNEAEQINQFNQRLCIELEKGILTTENHQILIQFLLSNLPYKESVTTETLKKLQLLLIEKGFQDDLASISPPGLILFSKNDIPLQIALLILLAIPAMAGLLLNSILYVSLKRIIQQKTTGTVFFDSAMFAALLLFYPLYYLIINFCIFILTHNLLIRVMVLSAPFFALASILFVEGLQRITNYYKLEGERRIQLKRLFDFVKA